MRIKEIREKHLHGTAQQLWPEVCETCYLLSLLDRARECLKQSREVLSLVDSDDTETERKIDHAWGEADALLKEMEG